MAKLINGREIQSRGRADGTGDEPGDAAEQAGRGPRGPPHGDGDGPEPREDPRVPVQAGRDDVRGDREGHGAPAAGGQNRDAGPPPAEVGREAGHQEGGQGPPRPRVPAQPALVRGRRPSRPRGASEGRPDRDEPQEAQVLRVGRRVRTPFAVPARPRSANPTKRPGSTTTESAWAGTSRRGCSSRCPCGGSPRPAGGAPGRPRGPGGARGPSASRRGGPRRGPASGGRGGGRAGRRGSGAAPAGAREGGTPRRPAPPATSRASPSRTWRAVDPVPRPRTMPDFTCLREASAAARFISSGVGIERLRRRVPGPRGGEGRGPGKGVPRLLTLFKVNSRDEGSQPFSASSPSPRPCAARSR